MQKLTKEILCVNGIPPDVLTNLENEGWLLSDRKAGGQEVIVSHIKKGYPEWCLVNKFTFEKTLPT